MIWSSLFVLCVAQGVFLVLLLTARRSRNSLGSRLIIILVLLVTLANFGYIVVRTGLVSYIPQAFGVSFGMVSLFGPLFYFYTRSVIDSTFRWTATCWLHFVPYLIQVLIALPLLTADRALWIGYISGFLSGNSQVRKTEVATFVLQDLQFSIYLYFTLRAIRSARKKDSSPQLIVSLPSRIQWLTALSFCFILFAATVFVLHLVIIIHGMYIPTTNYVYAFASSGIIYFIAYKLVLNPEPISPDFSQKYRTYMQFSGEDGERYVAKIRSLMSDPKLFTNPDLNLPMLAGQVGLPSHQLSKLINEKFQKSFTDFVNELRVGEFIRRINTPEYRSYSIYGLAQEVGFNSKSSFNAAFKRITGTSPARYKISS